MTFRLQSMIIATIAFLGTKTAVAGNTTWFFSAAQIDAAYRYQEQFGSRLRNPLKPNACFAGKSEFVASYQSQEFVAPCRFVTETMRQLKLMLENGAAHYLFPLDADHAHLAVPKKLFASERRKLSGQETLARILKEPELVALYHTAEHLAAEKSTNEKDARPIKEWLAKRNVMGFFDGRPLKILPPRPDGSAREVPEQFENIASVYFLAHRLGEMVLSANGKAVSFDLSFDEDSAAGMP